VLASWAFTITCGGGGGGTTRDAAARLDGSPDSSRDGAIDPCAGGCAANTWDADHDPNTGTCGCEYQCVKISDTDPIDDTYTDENCDGGDGIVAQCVYVSTSLGDDANGTGTRQSPVKTLTRGIALAQANSIPAVCASGETYNEKVTVVSGINIYGGFDQANAFKRSPTAITTVQAAGVVFDAPQINADTYLAGLTIQATANPVAGASVYGVRLVAGAAQLIVQYNTITVANGNTGGSGTDGAAQLVATADVGQNGTNGTANGSAGGGGGAQGTCTEYGGKGGMGGYGVLSGDTGGSGTGGATPGTGGHADSQSFCSGVTGNNVGQPGGAATVVGSNGTAGAGGLALGTIVAGDYKVASGANGTIGGNGKGGSGGGGGGGGDQVGGTFCNPDRGGGGAAGGCGGLGGNFGTGGGGGGASFGVFAVAGHIVVGVNHITTGNGGNGGTGGKGAIGQVGGGGGTGGLAADDGGPGGNGGSGTNGGAGAPGGGGGGGPTACLAYGSTALFSYSSNVVCVHGTAGQGAAGGTFPSNAAGNAGAAGTAGATIQIP